MMQPARSCFSCHYGGTERGTNCKSASDRLCCDDWTKPKTLKVLTSVEFDLDIRDIAEQYGESIPDIITPEDLDCLFKDIFRLSVTEFISRRLFVNDDHHALNVADVRDYEISYDTSEEFRLAVAKHQEQEATA